MVPGSKATHVQKLARNFENTVDPQSRHIAKTERNWAAVYILYQQYNNILNQ
jgi:hypothetical protein